MLRIFRCALLFSALSTSLLYAQQSLNQASIEGRVLDQSGAVLPAARVDVLDVATGAHHRAVSGRDGLYRVPYLSPGTVEVTVTAPGFSPEVDRLDLHAGTSSTLAVTLCVGVVETVDPVTADAASVDTRTESATTILTQEVTGLPFLSRNFLDLALLAPGVSATNTNANQLFAETSAVPGQGISINSQRNFSNSFLIDGLSANDDAAGLVTTALPLESVAELQVVTSGGQAEFGRAIGGYLNFVTRGGSNALHGTAYGFLRNQRLNAANALTQSVIPMTQAQFGGSVGGPIVHDRTFFFANAEQRNLNQNNILTITPANAAQINARLTAVGYGGPLLALSNSATTLFPDPAHATNLFARVDHSVSQHDTLTARYSLYRVNSLNARGAGSLTYTSAGASVADTDHTVAVSNIWTLSTHTVNETRAQFTHSDLGAPVNDPTGPAVSISGVATFGTLSGSPTGRVDGLGEVVDNISHSVGAHALRGGVDFLYNDLTITFPQSARGSYAFSSLANFLAGKYSTFTQSFGNPVVHQTNPNVGMYAQDEWRATPSLTINAGLRYDLQFLQSVAVDTRQVSPRLGLSWLPFADRRTVLRASYGLFYDRVPLRSLSNALESNGNSTTVNSNTFVTLALNYGQAGAPAFPAIATGYNAATIPATARISLTTMDPHLRNASSQQASLEVEQQLSSRLILNVGFQHVRGEHLLLSINENTPACPAVATVGYTGPVDPVNLCRPNPGLGNVKQYSAAADSIYDGLAVSLLARPMRYGNFRLSYTWSHALDDLGEFFFSAPANNFDVSEDWSRSDDDQRHRISLDGTLHSNAGTAHSLRQEITNHWQIGGILQYASKLPFNIVTGGQTIQTTSQRPCAPGGSLTGVTACTLALPGALIGRNAGIGFDQFNVNARVARTFPITERMHVDAIAQAFNALNHRNNLIPNATFGAGTFPTQPSATFGQPTATADPRSVEFAVRLSF